MLLICIDDMGVFIQAEGHFRPSEEIIALETCHNIFTYRHRDLLAVFSLVTFHRRVLFVFLACGTIP